MQLSWAEIFGFVTGAACVWLLVKQSIWNWPVAMANYLFFAVLFYQSKLYGDMSLQFFYTVIAVYGWWNWLRGGTQHSQLKISRAGATRWMFLLLGTALMSSAFTFALSRYTDSNVPFLDGVTTALSVTALFMQTRKWLENWYVWIVADVLYIGLYIMKHLYLTAGLYAIFIAMCIAGLLEWQKSLRAQAELEAVPV
jgi:nicotinamide mononucleotide transporter